MPWIEHRSGGVVHYEWGASRCVCLGAPGITEKEAARGGAELTLDAIDVLPKGLALGLVHFDVADAHVHGRIAVGPDHLAAQRQRRAELGEVDDQVDHGADLLDA